MKTEFELQKETYEPVVKKALETWDVESVLTGIYELFQDYRIDEDCEDYLYGVVDPDDKYDVCPAELWWNNYPAPNLYDMYLGKSI